MRRRTLLQGEGVIDITSAVVTAASQTYDGTAKTPAVTVTLHGSVIDAANYDVTYSSNTNAGTAYMTVTGKGDYTGTATGTFNIAKSAPSYTAPTATNPTYNGSSQQLTTTGTTAHGTIQYSADGSSWADLPIERTNAGGYTTYWRLVGDANHTSIGATSITTYIYKASRMLSFSSSYAVLDHGGTVTRTATVSAGAGDGAVTYSVGSTTYASVGYTSGKVTAKSTDGSTTITATISEGTNYLSASASYTLYVFSTAAHDYSYNGSYHSVTLPPGRYNLQVWGAQGGSNAADPSYGITAQAGGKGGYSEGVLTLTSATDVRVYVGGAGSSSAGGYNGGGSTRGSSSYSSGNIYGTSRMGGGGGATDIRLSDGALLSRMIVAGGGSGGAMSSSTKTETTTVWTSWDTKTLKVGGANYDSDGNLTSTYYGSIMDDFGFTKGKTYKITSFVVTDGAGFVTESNGTIYLYGRSSSNGWQSQTTITVNSAFTVPTSSHHYALAYLIPGNAWVSACRITVTFEVQETQTSTDTITGSQVGYVGGGTNAGGYSSSYYGKQNGAGSNGSFGLGANQTVTNYRYCSGAGGGGWYGGGMNYSDSDMNACKMSGGGSGFVNTAASAGNRPSGYTGLQLDSGTTYAGNQSFPNTAGSGNETGHSGNGYAKITRIAVLNITLRFKNEDNEPITNAGVTLTSGSDTHTSTTDTSGEATFTVQNGTYNVSCVGYALTPSQITITKNQTFDFVAELPSIREYAYTGSVQQDTLPAGTYKIECWGAQGGYRSSASYGGKGGYSVGKLTLSQNTNIYVYVGGSGNTGGTSGGFNGGGTRATYAGGGGGSDVRIGQDSLYARVIVAGGGGSDGATSKQGMYGGGTTGGTATQNYGTGGGGGTQTSGGTGSSSASGSGTSGTYGAFGVGGRGYAASNGYAGAGGGGWYGGAGSYPDGSGDDDRGGGGGSGYVYTSGTAGNYPSGCLLNSSHYLTDAETKAGNVSFPSTSGGTETGHSGNGYIRITKV